MKASFYTVSALSIQAGIFVLPARCIQSAVKVQLSASVKNWCSICRSDGNFADLLLTFILSHKWKIADLVTLFSGTESSKLMMEN